MKKDGEGRKIRKRKSGGNLRLPEKLEIFIEKEYELDLERGEQVKRDN